MRFFGIVALCVLASIVYGILHDQVTARVCVEYFTLGHPRIIESESPTLLAFAWGVVATWWMGLFLGILVALFSCVGHRPTLGPRDLLRPMAILLGVMAALALLAGIAGYAAAKDGRVILLPPLAERLPRVRHAAFIADLWAHRASYATGLLGAIVLCKRIVVWRRRRGATNPPAQPA